MQCNCCKRWRHWNADQTTVIWLWSKKKFEPLLNDEVARGVGILFNRGTVAQAQLWDDALWHSIPTHDTMRIRNKHYCDSGSKRNYVVTVHKQDRQIFQPSRLWPVQMDIWAGLPIIFWFLLRFSPFSLILRNSGFHHFQDFHRKRMGLFNQCDSVTT